MPSFPAGALTPSGEWVPVPYVDPKAAERLFRHKVLRFLRREEVISQERLELLLSWRHSGFSVHNEVRLPAGDTKALEVLVRYMSRPAVSLARLVLQPASDEVLYFPKPGGHDGNAAGPEHIDAELGEIVNGIKPAGRAGYDLTLFKSVGNAAQDVAVAAEVLQVAERDGLGTTVEI